MMEKNGNTFVPGDRVHVLRGGKTASKDSGTVVSAVEGRLKVSWDDGTETYERPENLVK